MQEQTILTNVVFVTRWYLVAVVLCVAGLVTQKIHHTYTLL